MSYRFEGTVRFPRGDAKFVPFTLRDEDGEPLDLNNAEIVWKLQNTRTREDLLTLEDEGVDIISRNDEEGEFEIRLQTTATSELDSTDYREIVQVTSEDGGRTTWIGQGTFILEEV